MTNVQSSGPSLNSFLALAQTNEALVLKGGELKPTSEIPAKLGFFGRAVQWLKTSIGMGPDKANEATRAAFTAALAKQYGEIIADATLHQVKTYQSNDKPLSSRDIQAVASRADQLILLRNHAALCKLKLAEAEGRRDLKLFGLELKAAEKGGKVPIVVKMAAGSEFFLAKQQADEAEQAFKAELFKKV
ncbi:hypothetical protein [Pantoea sp. 18069]|uniref:hypothetical protein n=1 Tax=Pantoea sp. 18069 TaxID=2681415 RepID=UPI00135A1ED4|nr:hypothetical protein [Pantoea sp. 18069]